MQIDELRSELTRLAEEIGPFTGDVHELHRRQRRRRVVTSSLLVVLIVVAGASTLTVLARHHDSTHNVTAVGPKGVSAAEISRVDVIIVPANPAVQDVLGASPLVAYYTPGDGAPFVPARRSLPPAPPSARWKVLTASRYKRQLADPTSHRPCPAPSLTARPSTTSRTHSSSATSSSSSGSAPQTGK